jgi:thymidine kinase
MSLAFVSNGVSAMDETYYYDTIKSKSIAHVCNENVCQGKLYFYYGVMGAGKSKLAIEKLKVFRDKGLKTYVYVPENLENREKISSRANIQAYTSNIELDNVESNSYLIVDEAQFLSDDEINTIKNICASKNVTALCFGLLTTFQFELFEGSKKLVECADSVTKISMPCENCNENEAICNFRMSSNNKLVVLDKNQYKSLCEDCYKKFISYKINENLVTNFLQFNSSLICQ